MNLLHNRGAETPKLRLELDAMGRMVIVAYDELEDVTHVVVLTAEAEDRLRDQAAAAITEQAKRQTGMEVQVSALRYANYGDHAAMDHHALQYDPTETVEALVLRGLDLTSAYGRTNLEADHIVLRVIQGTEPERSVSSAPPF